MSAPDSEPLIHSHWTDVLPEDHPKAYESVYCDRCQVMLHATNNECMQTWIDWGGHALCGPCFAPLLTQEYCVLEWADFEKRCKRS